MKQQVDLQSIWPVLSHDSVQYSGRIVAEGGEEKDLDERCQAVGGA